MKMECPIAAHHDMSEPALVDGSTALSYSELDRRVQAAMAELRGAGMQAGERVVLAIEPRVEFVVTLFAIWRLGACACLVNPRFPQARQVDLGHSVGATFWFSKVQADKPPEPCESVLNLGNDGVIIFSSGSTGEAKAALLSLANLYCNALGSNEFIPVTPGSRWLLSLPLFHVGGLGILWRCFLAGGTVVLPGDNHDLLDKQITHVSMVPTQLQRLLQQDCVPELQALLLGGAVLPEELCRAAIDRGIPLFTTYGCTEMASQVATGKRPDDVGSVLPHRELVLAEDGEILLRGPTLFRGYVTDDGLDPARDANGWYHSGDLGELHDGRLRIIGRKDNMMISGGENIQPEEIESALLAVPGITDAIVVPVPDLQYGQRPVAFLAGSWDADQIEATLRAKLPGFMVPDAFHAMPDFDTLKPSRKELAERARAT